MAGPRPEKSASKLAQISDAKQQFLDATLNMSWQLAVTIIVPVVIGVQLDKHFNTSPSYTLAALFLAVTLAAYVVVKTVRGVKVPASNKRKGPDAQ